MVEQFGLATMPLCVSSASGFTSLTTRGTFSLIRQREELSTTTAPAAAKRGAHSPEVAPPAENRATSKPLIDSSSNPRTWRPPSSSLPTERAEAKGTTSRAGKCRSRSSASISVPTCPVAPTTATRYPSALTPSGYRGACSLRLDGHDHDRDEHQQRPRRPDDVERPRRGTIVGAGLEVSAGVTLE